MLILRWSIAEFFGRFVGKSQFPVASIDVFSQDRVSSQTMVLLAEVQDWIKLPSAKDYGPDQLDDYVKQIARDVANDKESQAARERDRSIAFAERMERLDMEDYARNGEI